MDGLSKDGWTVQVHVVAFHLHVEAEDSSRAIRAVLILFSQPLVSDAHKVDLLEEVRVAWSEEGFPPSRFQFSPFLENRTSG